MRRVLLAVVLLGISCTNPLCGCTPAPVGVVLRGTLQNAGGDPLGGQRVRSETSLAGCTEFDPSTSVVTAANGSYSLFVIGQVRDSMCVRLFARADTVGATESPVGSVIRTVARPYPYDTLDVPLTLGAVVR